MKTQFQYEVNSRLKKLREEKKYTQASISKLLEISPGQLGNIESIKQEHKNNQSPRLTVFATVVAKRDHVSVHHHDHHRHTNTRYFVTFQVNSGDRMELQLSGSEYGMLIEGDQGQLTFQGTRFLSFERV